MDTYSAEYPEQLASAISVRERRVLLLGPPGVGKTTLSSALARELANSSRMVWYISADPGTPGLGVPGALSLGVWIAGSWEVRHMCALCTLDAARFRLPLVEAVAHLATWVGSGSLLIDSPGVVRGVAGAELLQALVRVAAIDLVLVLQREGHPPYLFNEVSALTTEVLQIKAARKAERPSKSRRARERTQLWNNHLAKGCKHRLSLTKLHVLGIPPPRRPDDWIGKQIAFLESKHTVSMGEVIQMDGDILEVLLPPDAETTSVLLVRDAQRDESDLLVTGKPFAENIVRYVPPSDLIPEAMKQLQPNPRPMVKTGSVASVLMNGVFGDPQLHLRFLHQRRSLLFDLGDGARLPARLVHQVSDVFITHAHMDHISGFLWLLRSRMGEHSHCRIYGPPGLSKHLQHLIDGICWDRIEDRGPRFEVAELRENWLQHFSLQAGYTGPKLLRKEKVVQGIVLDEPGFRIRAVTLDHGIPVLAYAFEPTAQINVRRERLQSSGLEPGPWLTELKQSILAKHYMAKITLPNGRQDSVAALGAELTLVCPGSKLVYATDFADTQDNRRSLIQLAEDAHTLFCEATFLGVDAEYAHRSGHLTSNACAEIANAARVQYLVPFHFSRRYEKQPIKVYEEIAKLCPNVVMPHGLARNDIN